MLATIIFFFIDTTPPQSSTLFFLFNDPATTEIYPLPLHDALPIYAPPEVRRQIPAPPSRRRSRFAPRQSRGGPRRAAEIGTAHISTPATVKARMPTSA